VAYDNSTARLLEALETRDPRRLRSALAVGAQLVHDSGTAAGGIHRGRRRVVTQLLALVPAGVTVHGAAVNAADGIVLVAPDGAVCGVLALEGGPRGVTRVWASTSAEKLRGWVRPGSSDA